jgi:hypothetical protein
MPIGQRPCRYAQDRRFFEDRFPALSILSSQGRRLMHSPLDRSHRVRPDERSHHTLHRWLSLPAARAVGFLRTTRGSGPVPHPQVLPLAPRIHILMPTRLYANATSSPAGDPATIPVLDNSVHPAHYRCVEPACSRQSRHSPRRSDCGELLPLPCSTSFTIRHSPHYEQNAIIEHMRGTIALPWRCLPTVSPALETHSARRDQLRWKPNRIQPTLGAWTFP